MKMAMKTKAAILYETLSHEVYDSDNSADSVVILKCTTCSRTFTNPVTLKVHIQAAHSAVEDAIALTELRETRNVPCPCPQCGRVFKTSHYLSQHIQFKHNAIPKPKPLTDSRRNRHIYLTQAEYNDMLSADGEEKWILCPHCLHVPFKAQQNLNQHLTIIHPDHALDPRVITKLKEGDTVNELLAKASQSSLSKRKKKKASAASAITGVVLEEVEDGEEAKYDREARRKSYTNDFKATVIEELQNGVSRKSLSLLHDIPMRTLDKWATSEKDRIMVASRFNHIAGHKRIRSEDLNNFLSTDEIAND